jgi:hypothetical protein
VLLKHRFEIVGCLLKVAAICIWFLVKARGREGKTVGIFVT